MSKPSRREDARSEAKIFQQLRITTRTTRIQSDAKNLLFDCLLNKLVWCYARSATIKFLPFEGVVRRRRDVVACDIKLAIIDTKPLIGID